MRLLITDLDNTLYDWVSYFAKAFQAMVTKLAVLLAVDEETLKNEFKRVHQRYGNSEHPFAVLDLPSVRTHFPGASRSEMFQHLEGPLAAFRDARGKYLKLYPSVYSTLVWLSDRGVVVVGHTEAIAELAYYRLQMLGILPFFTHLYALDGELEPHPDPNRDSEQFRPQAGLITFVPKEERKPNPALLQDICSNEGFPFSDGCYVGDSLVRDVAMAKRAGLTAVWARYGTNYPADLWQAVVRVTHRTELDVARESELRAMFHDTQPDHTIDSFSEILPFFDNSEAKSLSDMPAEQPADVA